MDPATIIGLICSVLQLIETGITIGKKIDEIYKKGSIAASDEVRDWATSVRDRTGELQAAVPRRSSLKLTKFDKHVLDLAQKVAHQAELLREATGFLLTEDPGRAPPTGFQRLMLSSKNAVKTTFSKKPEKLQSQLAETRQELNSALLSAIYVRGNSEHRMLASVYPKLSKDHRALLKRLAADHVELLGAIKTVEKQLSQAFDGLTRQLQDDKITMQRTTARKNMMDSLQFSTMLSRRIQVQDNVGDYGETLRWIFEPQRLHGFYEWLSCGQGVYWISGLPGSGKSSLVEYILQHLEAEGKYRTVLNTWAAGGPIIVLNFFFYSPSADPLQKTFEGFYRSLCFQMLEQDQSLYDRAIHDAGAPGLFRRWSRSGHEYSTQWLPIDLKTMFFYFLGLTGCSVLILLDGLDEFGDARCDDSHHHLVEILERISAVSKVKICCASRPDAPFDTAFEKYSQLRVQDLTRDDIDSYVRQRVTTCKGLSKEESDHLHYEVIHGAQGVFLWARVVTEEIKRQNSQGESLDELHLITRTHGDLPKLFKAMLSRANSWYTPTPQPFLQYVMLLKQSEHDVALSTLLFAQLNHDELDKCLETEFSVAFVEGIIERARKFKQQVQARCAGLVTINQKGLLQGGVNRMSYCGPVDESLDLAILEQISRHSIEFIHRTAHDFLKNDDEGRDFVAECSIPEETAILNLLRASTARLLLGVDHPLIGRYSRSGNSLCFDALDALAHVQELLEGSQSSHKRYHFLTNLYIDKLIRDMGFSPETKTREALAFLKAFHGHMWPTDLDLGASMRLSHGCYHGLVSYVKSCAMSLAPSSRRLATILIWCQAARSVLRDDAKKLLECMTDLQKSCGIDAGDICPSLYVTYYLGDFYPIIIPEQPLWRTIAAFLLEPPPKGLENFEVNHRPIIQAVLQSLQNAHFPKDEVFGISILTHEDSHTRLVPTPVRLAKGTRPEASELQIICSFRSIVNLLLPNTGLPEWRLTGTGELPFAVQWRPYCSKSFYKVQKEQSSDLWILKNDRYEVNRGYFRVKIEDTYLAQLKSGRKIGWPHTEFSPGCFECFCPA